VALIWTWQFDRARPISPADKPAADSPAAGNVR
jgi:hypothetical protein